MRFDWRDLVGAAQRRDDAEIVAIGAGDNAESKRIGCVVSTVVDLLPDA